MSQIPAPETELAQFLSIVAAAVPDQMSNVWSAGHPPFSPYVMIFSFVSRLTAMFFTQSD